MSNETMCMICEKDEINSNHRIYYEEGHYVCSDCAIGCIKSFLKQRDMIKTLVDAVNKGEGAFMERALQMVFKERTENDFLQNFFPLKKIKDGGDEQEDSKG